MWRHIASNFLTLLIVAVFLLGGVILWGERQYRTAGPLEQQICLRVERGSNVIRVSRKLEQQGAVTSGTIFRLGMNYGDKAGQLKAGAYLVPPGSSMAEIADIVTRGGASTCGTEVVYRIGVTRDSVQVRQLDPATSTFVELAAFQPGEGDVPAAFTKVRAEPDTRYRIAMAEGATSWQVVQALKSIDVLTGEIKDVPPEGVLAPDSYEVRVGDDRAALLKAMQDAQELRLATAWEGRDKNLPLASPEEALILASIVEKETGGSDESRAVASVFVNRLRDGMKLQTDPTVIYGVTKGQGVLGRGLRQSELRKKTPYNTYVITGLPPTPIANPGRSSIEAAVHPANTDYIFFVARTLNPRDGHVFSSTLDEHNANVRKLRALEKQQGSD